MPLNTSWLVSQTSDEEVFLESFALLKIAKIDEFKSSPVCQICSNKHDIT